MAMRSRKRPDATDSEPADLGREIATLRRELAALNGQRFLRIHNSWWRLLLMRFVSGLFTGLGTVIGATVLVSIVVYWLQGIEWVPLIGEWASEVATQIEKNLESAVESGVEQGMENASQPETAPDTPAPGAEE